jgi:heavy metal sensor kinase
MRWRLLAWIGLLVALMLVAFGVTAYDLTRRMRLEQLDAALEPRVAAVAQGVRTGPGGPPLERMGAREGGEVAVRRRPPDWEKDGREPPEGPSPGKAGERPMNGPPEPPGVFGGARTFALPEQAVALFDEADVAGPFYVVWSRQGQELKRSANAPAGLALPARSAVQPGIKFATVDGRRLAYYWTERGDCALVGISLATYQAQLRDFVWWLCAVGLGVLAVGGGGGWLIISRALRPVAQISAAAQRIAAGDLTERIHASDPDSELGRLAGVLNSTFARLETSFAEQRQFTADASHEVRTPLTVIISEAQAALARSRSEAEYRETLEVCLEAAQDMRRLADSLLDLARLDGGQEAANRTELDLAELAETCGQLVRPLAEARGIAVNLELQPAPLRADPGRLRQVLINLLDNAIHYNYDRGTIEVRVRRDGAWVVLEVADTGRGIAPEHLPHIFKRFFRGSTARTSTERRAGLGLAIVHSIVEAHGGTIGAESRLGLGTTFTVRLPA